MRRTTGSTRAVLTAPRRSSVSIRAAADFAARPNVFTSLINQPRRKLKPIIAEEHPLKVIHHRLSIGVIGEYRC
jgi:hypothetical protein